MYNVVWYLRPSNRARHFVCGVLASSTDLKHWICEMAYLPPMLSSSARVNYESNMLAAGVYTIIRVTAHSTRIFSEGRQERALARKASLPGTQTPRICTTLLSSFCGLEGVQQHDSICSCMLSLIHISEPTRPY